MTQPKVVQPAKPLICCAIGSVIHWGNRPRETGLVIPPDAAVPPQAINTLTGCDELCFRLWRIVKACL